MNLKGVTLFLVGMMGAGKSTTGKALADQLGYKFFDTDVLIEQLAQKPINDIFSESGEETFRELETQVLSELSSYRKLVVATGGGIVLRKMNWSYLRHGLVVWLDLSAQDLWERLKDDNSRPLLKTDNPLQTLEQKLEERHELYNQADVHVSIPGNADLASVQELIWQAIQPHLRDESNSLSQKKEED